MLQLAGVNEAEINKGLSPEALVELDACLRASLPVIEKSEAALASLSEMGTLVAEHQSPLERCGKVLARLRKLDTLKRDGSPRAELIDDTIDALSGVGIVFVQLKSVFVLTPEQQGMVDAASKMWRRCYACLKVVGVGWGNRLLWSA